MPLPERKGVQRALWKKRISNEGNERSQAANVQRELWEGLKRRNVGSTEVVNGVKGKSEYPIGDLKTIDGKGRMLDGSQGMEPKEGSEYSTGGREGSRREEANDRREL